MDLGISVETIAAVTPFILGGIGYAVHNERRLTKIETKEVSLKEQVNNVEGKVDQIYDLALQIAMSNGVKCEEKKVLKEDGGAGG